MRTTIRARTVSYSYGTRLESATTSTGVHYFDFNALGSTAGLSGPAGTYLNTYLYEPFGLPLLHVESLENPFEFVGEFGVQAEDNGLTFMRARYYDLQQGRIIRRKIRSV